MDSAQQGYNMDIETSHSTRNEIAFIRNLGMFRPKEKRKETRSELLDSYLASCAKRVNWDDIYKSKCIRFAKKELKKCA